MSTASLEMFIVGAGVARSDSAAAMTAEVQ
jgi:hypothetical protein